MLIALGCESKKRGELVVAVATDMAMPQQIDSVFLQVEVRGETIHRLEYPVGSGTNDNSIPATLTLVEGDQAAPVTIRVAGEKKGKWRTFREVTTTVPEERSALLRMPIQWLCDESAKAVTFNDGAVTQIRMLSACEEEDHSCVSGRCVPNLVDSKSLPDYSPDKVFGGADRPEDGTCFDTVPCMLAGRVVEPDENCTVPKPLTPEVNIGLRVTNDGICDQSQTVCFVTLDANTDGGWTTIQNSDRLQLPEAVCTKLKARTINAVYVSTECPAKRAGTPPCGAWSKVGKKKRDTPAPGTGGPDGMPAPRATLVTNITPDPSLASVCCPLLSDAGNAYTCVCTSKTNATMVGLDLTRGSISMLASFNPPGARENPRFPAVAWGSALYWAADQNLERTALPSASDSSGTFMVGGSLYERSTLLASDTGIYALASAVTGAMGAPVQLVALQGPPFDPSTSKWKSFDTGATQPVFQFDHDDGAVYLAVDVDEEVGPDRKRRKTSVVRINKADGARTTILEERTLEIDAALRGGGYTGVQVDGGALYALFEDAPAADGSMTVQVQRLELGQSQAPAVVYETRVDPAISQLGIVGVVDGAVILSRVETATDMNTRSVRSASVVAIPPGGGTPRIIADYSRDYPGFDLITDAERVYWLNSSGRLYSYPRSALR